MPSVRIRGLEETIEAQPGATLLDACKKNRVNLFWGPWARALNCRGRGLCAACKVAVVEGADTLPPRTKHETRRLAGKPAHWRLACELPVTQDLAIQPFPRVAVAERVLPEALRRAKLSPEQRQREAEARRAARKEQHDRERADAKDRPRERKPGRIARLVQRKKKEPDADAAPTKVAAKVAEAEDAPAEPKRGRLAALKRGRGKTPPS